MEAAGITVCRFLRKNHGLAFRGKVRGCEIRKSLNVEPPPKQRAPMVRHVTEMFKVAENREVFRLPTGLLPSHDPTERKN